jgi:nickel/cobalt exporter
MEREIVGGLEARPVVRRLARQADLDGNVEEDREVRPEPVGRDRFQPVEVLERQAATVALVGLRRVRESSADDRGPCRESRLDHLDDELVAGSVEEERIGDRVDPAGAGIEEELADPLAERRPARLPRPDDRHAALRQVRLEASRLGRLAGALWSFDGDEPAPGSVGRVTCHAGECMPPATRRARGRPARPPRRSPCRLPCRHPPEGRRRTLGIMGRRAFRTLSAVALVLLASLAIPLVAAAHPLGNFTINHYAGITVSPAAIHLDIVIDMAEIPAFQERRRMDADGDGTVDDAESEAGATADCVTLMDSLELTRNGTRLALTSAARAVSFPPGAGGLSTLRLECSFDAALDPAIAEPTTIDFTDRSYTERIGWREIVVEADGVAVDSHGLPTTSPSQRLTAYPADMISLPLDVRSASLVARPAAVSAASARPTASPAAAPAATAGAVPGGVSSAELPEIFRSADLTPVVLFASLITAVGLGAGHAVTPGHGKTLMAAYLVGSRGTAIHAVGLGLSVAVSHTLGILALALLIVGAEGVLPPDVVYRAAPVVAAISIVAIGGWLLAGEIRRRVRAHRVRASIAVAGVGDPGHDHEHASDHEHPHADHVAEAHDHDVHDHDHDHDHDAGEHSHGGIRHSHLPPAGSTLSWRGLFALGLAGGLIPSASALLILLFSIETGRPAFGFILVLAFGLGMALVMSCVGLGLIVARGRLNRLPRRSALGRLAGYAPLIASIAVLGLGLVLTWQAVAGRPAL